MVAATQQQQGTVNAPSAEEEALKRNTDCVYFLASPLTCKKGSECEYRHSEYARVNPRDCYFWLNGNCLNPKCGFRHPPLDGLFGAQAAASSELSLPPAQMAAISSSHTQNSGKQAVPCIFFQKGHCLKGDWCAFSHGPTPTTNKISHPIAPKPTAELLPPTKPQAHRQKISQQQKIPPANFLKAVEAPSEIKLAPKPETRRNGVGVERKIPPSKNVKDEVPRHKATNLHPVVDGNSSHFNHLHQPQVSNDHSFLNVKDADGFLRESSPGFDVLVDDELRNSDFYHGEDQYGRTRGQDGRNLDSVDGYDMGHSADYGSVADMDRETYHDLRGYDDYECTQGQTWVQHRASERMLLGPAELERRGYSKVDSPEPTNDLDLRYRLSKHRRVNGLRSVVNHDFARDNNIEERGYQGSWRDSHNLPSHESSIGGRLRGRIKHPGRSSNDSDLHAREIDKGWNHGRLSPGRSHVPSHQGRLRGRIQSRVEEEMDTEGRNLRSDRMRREMADDRSTDFAGPKSLAELKGTRNTEVRVQQSLRKRKQLEDHQASEGDLSFEGPMPLSEILKRKREAGAAASGAGISSMDKYDDNQKEPKESLPGSSKNTTVTGMESSNDVDKKVLKDEEASKSATDVENTEVALGKDFSELPNAGEPDTEDGMIVDDGVEDHEYEDDDQREGDYEYEQVDEGEYYEEGENADAEEEDVDDEDGDDFAKKIGVMFS